jgi:hypothetical protein
MTAFEEIMKSLQDNPHEWKRRNINAMKAIHKHGLEIWLDNIPVVDTNVSSPASLKLNLWQKYKLYKAAMAIDYDGVKPVDEAEESVLRTLRGDYLRWP